MPSQVKVLLVTLAFGSVVAWGPKAARAVSSLETFQISDVEVLGVQYVEENAVVEQMQLGQFASVWGDRDEWAERLVMHPLIQTAEVRRRLPNRLQVTIVERRPVALAPTPMLEPVDADGFRLPIDPTIHRLDLPVIASHSFPPEDAYVFPQEVRALAAELERLTLADEDFVNNVSTIERMQDGALRVRLLEPGVDIFLPPGTPVGRLNEAQAALRHAMSQNLGRVPEVIDLRYAGQVVVRGSR